MRTAIYSDVHGNLEALEAVFKDIDKQQVADIMFLGDAVGYGANPNECVELIKQNTDVVIVGNHDLAAVGLLDYSNFNERAAQAIDWTFDVLTEENAQYLMELPLTMDLEGHDFLLCHGSPYEPEEWHYVLNMDDVERSFKSFERRCCFVGHSHRPFISEKTSKGQTLIHPMVAQLNEGSRYVINDGSVGQPRDKDPRACYLVIDDDTAELVKVEYDIPTAQRKILDAGLPPQLAKRIALGR